jgi:hypothetical protein
MLRGLGDSAEFCRRRAARRRSTRNVNAGGEPADRGDNASDGADQPANLNHTEHDDASTESFPDAKQHSAIDQPRHSAARQQSHESELADGPLYDSFGSANHAEWIRQCGGVRHNYAK